METNMKTIYGLAAVMLAAGGLAGCAADFKPSSYVERARVLGARVSAAAEPGRAWVRPGEAASVTWLVAARQDPTPLSWAFALCAGDGNACAGQPLAVMQGAGTVPVVSFTMPDAGALGQAASATLLGAICAGGRLDLDPATMQPTCTGDSASLTDTAFTVPAQVGDATNHHPIVGDDLLQVDGADWPATDVLPAVDAPCDAASGLPLVAATAEGQTAVKHELRLVSDAGDRETYAAGDPPVAKLEGLQISQFTTAGKLEHAFSDIPASDARPDADATVKWEPPAAKDVPAGGQVVQFHFVARDLRGGIDWVHRAVCVPAP
jgi:hypothetical protein